MEYGSTIGFSKFSIFCAFVQYIIISLWQVGWTIIPEWAKNKEMYEKDKNYIIIAKKNTLELTYKQLEQELVNLLQKIKGEKNEK